jgi:spore germination protein YaaH
VYDILWTFNQRYAWQIANQYGITPVRNRAGEMHFTYIPEANAIAQSPVSLGPNSALLAAAAASAYADAYNKNMKFRLVDWPDAQSIAGKAELAERLGVRGISIFKWDGGEDQDMWKALVGVKK